MVGVVDRIDPVCEWLLGEFPGCSVRKFDHYSLSVDFGVGGFSYSYILLVTGSGKLMSNIPSGVGGCFRGSLCDPDVFEKLGGLLGRVVSGLWE